MACIKYTGQSQSDYMFVATNLNETNRFRQTCNEVFTVSIEAKHASVRPSTADQSEHRLRLHNINKRLPVPPMFT